MQEDGSMLVGKTATITPAVAVNVTSATTAAVPATIVDVAALEVQYRQLFETYRQQLVTFGAIGKGADPLVQKSIDAINAFIVANPSFQNKAPRLSLPSDHPELYRVKCKAYLNKK